MVEEKQMFNTGKELNQVSAVKDTNTVQLYTTKLLKLYIPARGYISLSLPLCAGVSLSFLSPSLAAPILLGKTIMTAKLPPWYVT